MPWHITNKSIIGSNQSFFSYLCTPRNRVRLFSVPELRPAMDRIWAAYRLPREMCVVFIDLPDVQYFWLAVSLSKSPIPHTSLEYKWFFLITSQKPSIPNQSELSLIPTDHITYLYHNWLIPTLPPKMMPSYTSSTCANKSSEFRYTSSSHHDDLPSSVDTKPTPSLSLSPWLPNGHSTKFIFIFQS